MADLWRLSPRLAGVLAMLAALVLAAWPASDLHHREVAAGQTAVVVASTEAAVPDAPSMARSGGAERADALRLVATAGHRHRRARPVAGGVPVVVTPGGDEPEEAPPSRFLGSPAFARLWAVQTVSAYGDWLGFLAIVALAARVGGGSPEAAISLVMAARLIPGFFLAPIVGVLVDRWDRKRVMVVCDLGRGVVQGSLGV